MADKQKHAKRAHRSERLRPRAREQKPRRSKYSPDAEDAKHREGRA